MNANKSSGHSARSGHVTRGHPQPPLPNSQPEVARRSKAPAAEGVYGNCRFMHAVTSMVGSVVRVAVKDGTFFEGVLRTFSGEVSICIHGIAY